MIGESSALICAVSCSNRIIILSTRSRCWTSLPAPLTPPDSTADLIPSHAQFAVTRRLGKAYGQVKVPNWPVHLFVNGDWQARVGVTQFAYLDENTTPAVYVGGVNTTCGAQCHYNSQFQPLNYTTRNIAGGADVDLGPVRLTYQHAFSSFNDRLVFQTGTFTGPFTPENEGLSVVNPPPSGPPPRDFPAGNYPIDIPSPSHASSDRVSLSWAASPKLTFNGNVDYMRLTDTFTNNPQNQFDTDETLNWLPMNRLRVTVDYHQQNLINNFTPYYTLYGNVSYHDHGEGVRLNYELPKNFDVEGYYRRSGITRSNASLWPQIYSIDNTDLQTVIPSSISNTTGLALRYHDRGMWSARAGYEWTGTHDPGYLVVPGSNNRIFTDVTLTPARWLIFTNDLSVIVQNAFPAIPLPNNTGLPPDFQRRNRFYIDTASATLPVLPNWNLGLGYSYQQNNLTTYMAFQNDSQRRICNRRALGALQTNQPKLLGRDQLHDQAAFGTECQGHLQLGAQRISTGPESERCGAAWQPVLDFIGRFRSGYVFGGSGQLGLHCNPDLRSDCSAVDRAIEGLLSLPAQVRGRADLLLR